MGKKKHFFYLLGSVIEPEELHGHRLIGETTEQFKIFSCAQGSSI